MVVSRREPSASHHSMEWGLEANLERMLEPTGKISINLRAIVHQLCSFHWEHIQFFILACAPVFLLSCLLINGIAMTRIQSAFDTSRSAIWTTNSWCKGTTYQLLGCLMSVKERYEMKTQNQPRPLRIVRRQRKRRNWALRVENKLRTEELKWKISIQPVMWIMCGLLLYSQPFITESILTYIYRLRSIVLIRAVGQRKNL